MEAKRQARKQREQDPLPLPLLPSGPCAPCAEGQPCAEGEGVVVDP